MSIFLLKHLKLQAIQLFKMRILLLPALLFAMLTSAQMYPGYETSFMADTQSNKVVAPVSPKVKADKNMRWRLDRNKLWTGSLVFVAGAAKGFNESLQFNYHGFEKIFPQANDQWFYPTLSFRNKYKDGDPAKGPRFPGATSVFVMFTDQYHLNNFIQRAAITGAIVVKIGEGKRPFRHYLFDAIYYTACYQAGFHAIYSPIRARNH